MNFHGARIKKLKKDRKYQLTDHKIKILQILQILILWDERINFDPMTERTKSWEASYRQRDGNSKFGVVGSPRVVFWRQNTVP